jgi:kinesin family protein C2/C3
MDGYNVSLFAYGQTGSGKTHTMEGPKSDHGVNFRALEQLFRVCEERSEHYEYTFQVSMLEIYNETLLDLLATYPAGD